MFFKIAYVTYTLLWLGFRLGSLNSASGIGASNALNPKHPDNCAFKGLLSFFWLRVVEQGLGFIQIQPVLEEH